MDSDFTDGSTFVSGSLSASQSSDDGSAQSQISLTYEMTGSRMTSFSANGTASGSGTCTGAGMKALTDFTVVGGDLGFSFVGSHSGPEEVSGGAAFQRVKSGGGYDDLVSVKNGSFSETGIMIPGSYRIHVAADSGTQSATIAFTFTVTAP